jgi:hypothetical protein
LRWARLPGAHDTDGVSSHFGVYDEQQAALRGKCNQYEAVLVRWRFVAQVTAPWIVEAGRGLLESHSVLSRVGRCLSWIPFELEHPFYVTRIFIESSQSVHANGYLLVTLAGNKLDNSGSDSCRFLDASQAESIALPYS